MQLADEHFRILVEQVEDYAIYFLAADGTVGSWNAGAQRLKGYESREIVGQSFATFFTAEDRAHGKPIHLLSRALRDGRVEDVGWRVRKDGSQFWASAVITTLRDASGAHIGFAKVTRDLTDRTYRAFVEASHAIVWTTDAGGTPNGDSSSWRDFTGQSADEWRSGNAWDVIHPDDLPPFRDAWERAKAAAQPLSAEYRLRRRDGGYVWMEVRALPFFDGDGRVREWFGVSLDIAARKEAQLRTAGALELWRTTLRSIGDAVIATDERGQVQFMNPIAERVTGWSEADASGRSLREVFPIFNEESGAPVENPVEKVLRHGAIVGLANHTVLRQRGGIDVPIDDSAAPIKDADGRITGVVLVFRDASEEKLDNLRRAFIAKATAEIVEAADYRDALARAARLAVPRIADWVSIDVVDPSTNRIEQLALAHVDPAKIEAAKEAARKYPPDPDAQAGTPNVIRTGRAELYREIPPELIEAAAVDDQHRRFLREMDLRSALVVPLRGRGPVFGAITFVLTSTTPRRYGDRDLELAEDLAARVGLIIERRRLEEEAARANRLKDEFLAVVSHELRTPLQAILGYAAILERGGGRDPAKAIAAIVRNATAQARLIDDILDVSRISRGKLQLELAPTDVTGPIRGALDTVRPSATAKQVRIVEQIDADLPLVHGDRERLQQIVWNLLSNAVKFTEPGGRIEARALRMGRWLHIEVSDTGKGIAREHLDAVFERFHQLDTGPTRQHGGMGLGLAIVRHLVEAHGGAVEAHSEGLGKGATFVVSLPAIVDAPRADTSTERAKGGEGDLALRGVRTLVIDDDQDARDLITELLGSAGATVSVAASAAEAFAMLQADPPDVIVCDVGMPDEDGVSFMRRVRSLSPDRGGDVPAIALSAYAGADDRKNAEAAGFQLHVAKPVTPDALVAAVQGCARRR